MNEQIILFAGVGFAAQMIDGALGMAYGTASTSFLLSLGIPPRMASASVHTAEVFTSGISGFCHFRLGNVDGALFRGLVVPGIVGGVLGAYILSSLPGEKMQPLVAVYLLAVGTLILRRAFQRHTRHVAEERIRPLGLVGGFLDAIGGGGWGPIVTSTLVANGRNPRFAVGSASLAEGFVTLAQAITFLAILGTAHWQIIAGLIIGGAIAAPLAARVCKSLPKRPFLVLVGLVVVMLSLRTLLQVFW